MAAAEPEGIEIIIGSVSLGGTPQLQGALVPALESPYFPHVENGTGPPKLLLLLGRRSATTFWARNEYFQL